MDEGAYLPPIVARVLGEITDFVTKLQQVKALGNSFDNSEYEAKLKADISEVTSAIAKAEAEIDALTKTPHDVDIKVNVDTGGALEKIGALGSLADLMAGNAGVSLAKQQIALNGLARLMSTPQFGGVGTGLAGAAGAYGRQQEGLGILDSLMNGGMAAAAGGAGRKGGGGGGGLLAALGFGTGMFGMAGAGSLAAFGGFGFEHLLGIGLGLGGFAAQGLGGAGILGLGAAATAGVGMGTDMAGMGQAAGDIKNVTQAQNALTQAIAVYGAGSQQATVAQARLNYTLSSFSPIAQAAVLAAANTGQSFHQQFNAATGAAESTGAAIINMAMQVGEKFLPQLGASAALNMGIIQKSLEGPQGLFQWFGTQGLQIFTDLENHFTKNLPTAMHAITQGVELLAKTIDYAANQSTGSFIKKIDDLLTRFNSPAGFKVWEGHMQHMITAFHQWATFFKLLIEDIAGLFRNSASEGQGIVLALTGMLQNLHDWENSAKGKNQMQAFFKASKDEVIALLNLLPALLGPLAQIELSLGTPLRIIVTALADTVKFMANIPGVGPILAWGAALGIVASKLGPISRGLSSLAGFAASGLGITLPAAAASPLELALTANTAAVDANTAALGGSDVSNIAGGAGKAGLFGLGSAEGAGLMGGAGVGTSLLAGAGMVAGAAGGDWLGSTVGQKVGGATGNAAGGVLGGMGGGAAAGAIVGSVIPGLGTAVGALVGAAIGGIMGVVTHLHAILPNLGHAADEVHTAVMSLFGGIGRFFKGIPWGSIADTVHTAVTGFFGGIGNFFKNFSWSGVANTVHTAVIGLFGDIGNFFSHIDWYKFGLMVGEALGRLLTDIASFFLTIIGRIPGLIGTILSAVGSFFGSVAGAFLGFVKKIPGWVVDAVGAIIGFFGAVGGFFISLPGKLVDAVGGMGKKIIGAIGNIASAIWDAITTVVKSIPGIIADAAKSAVKSAASGAGGFFTGLLGSAEKKTHAAGGFMGLGDWGIAGEAGAELFHVVNGGVQIYSNSQSKGMSKGSGSVAYNMPVNVSVSVNGGASANTAQQVGAAVQQAVRKELSGVIRHLNSGAYASR